MTELFARAAAPRDLARVQALARPRVVDVLDLDVQALQGPLDGGARTVEPTHGEQLGDAPTKRPTSELLAWFVGSSKEDATIATEVRSLRVEIARLTASIETHRDPPPG